MTFFLWSQFALVCLLGAMSPGPSLALIIRNSINFNRMSGIVASIAHGLGICVYATVTVIVLEFILRNSEKIFFVIQICGSLFLVILGFIKSVEFASLLSYFVLVYVISCFIISGINKQASSNWSLWINTLWVNK